MNVSPARLALSAVSLAVLAALSACGGDNDSAPSAIAEADSASVPWNTATTLDVTSNDTIANGSASVAIATAPAHGTATVAGGQVVYTPTTGYFGADTLAYTLSVAGKQSTASVQIAVQAKMTLQGTVHDDTMPGAQVVVTVGGVAQPAVTADPDGNYTLTVSTSSPTDFITLQATGAGAQSGIVLQSLVGDASAAAAVASETGVVAAAALPSANVTNVSTAIAVLSAQALGKAPASSADIAAAQGQFTAAQTLQMATAIKLVADEGVALPAGSANTLALVSNAAAYDSFVTAQVTTNSTVFNATQAAVLADPAIAVSPSVPAAGAADVSLLLTLGQGASATGATQLTLKGDGTATIGADTVQTAKWAKSSDGTAITVTYDTPQTYDALDTDTVDNNQYDATQTDVGFELRQLGTGTATLNYDSTITWTEGPNAGQTVTADVDWLTETLVGTTKTFAASEFAVGAEWAGVITTDFSPETSNWIDQDTLKVTGASTVVFERTQVTGTFAIVDGSLVVTTANGVFRYTRLFTGPKGEDRWLTTKLVGGASTWVYDAAVVKVTSGLSFTTASASNDWLSYINAGLAGGQFYIDLAANGTGMPVGTNPDGTPAPQSAGTWTIAADGSEVFSRWFCNDGTASCGQGVQRTWTLIGTSGKNIYVMERLHYVPDPQYDQYRVNVYTATN